jgi:hypothetical protein
LFNRTSALTSTAVSAYSGMIVRETGAAISSFGISKTSDTNNSKGSTAGQPTSSDYKTKKITGET